MLAAEAWKFENVTAFRLCTPTVAINNQNITITREENCLVYRWGERCLTIPVRFTYFEPCHVPKCAYVYLEEPLLWEGSEIGKLWRCDVEDLVRYVKEALELWNFMPFVFKGPYKSVGKNAKVSEALLARLDFEREGGLFWPRIEE